jgi:5-formyltetrahydrofolate cyclo-ligase
MHLTKAEARTILSQKRAALTDAECMKMDDLLLIQLQRIDWSSTAILASFYPFAHKNEPNTLLFEKYIKTLYPFILFCYPIIESKENQMDFYFETETLQLNAYGIQEPLPFNQVVPERIDTILVPLLGFDQKGHRVGYGKGYYDRYLAKANKGLQKIGVSYFEPMDNFTDTNEFDVPLSSCITPWNTYEFE